MDTLGTFLLTPGTPQRVTGPRYARWIAFRNDSPNYLYVMCGPNAPASPASPGSYQKTIPPYSGDNYDTYNNSIQLFDGQVYFYALAPTDLAGTGQLSNRQDLSIDAYDAEETPPQPYSGVGRQVDATSQQRVIALSATLDSGSYLKTGNVAPPAAGVTVKLFDIAAALLIGGNKYNYVTYTMALWPNDNGTAGGIDFTIQLASRTAADATIATATVARGQCYWGAANGIPMPYVMPQCALLRALAAPTPVSFDHFSVLLLTNGIANATSGLTFEIQSQLIGPFTSSQSLPASYGATLQGVTW